MMDFNRIAPLNERIAIEEIDGLARRDYDALVDGKVTPERFVESNRWGYYLCANTWIHFVSDVGNELLGNLLRASIKEVGLVPAISIAANVADQLVRAAHDAEHLSEMDSIPIAFSHPSNRLKEWVVRTTRLPFKDARRCLSFPKRFTPVVRTDSSRLHEEAITSFLETNAANVKTEYRINSLSPIVIGDGANRLPFRAECPDDKYVAIASLARDVMCNIVGEFEGLSTQDFPRIGPGATRNSGRSLYQRLEDIAKYGEYEFSHTPTWRWVTGFYHVPHPDLRERYYYRLVNDRKRRIVRGPRESRGFRGTSRIPQVCRITSVPKTYKKVRLIALEDVCNMSKQLFLKDKLMDRIAKSRYAALLPLTRQEENREMARFAAYTDALATLDLSHASDSVTKPLVRMLFPDSWWRGFERCVPYEFILDEADATTRRLHMFATMGCGCTFVVEALVFVSLVVAAVAYKLGVTPDEALDYVIPSVGLTLRELIRVMGDDIIVPSEFVEIVEDVLTFFGFSVNDDKSFVEGRFRESCGADWLRVDDLVGDSVIDVSCVYWPRIPLGRDLITSLQSTYSEFDHVSQERFVTTCVSRLVALQHKLYDIAPLASGFLFHVLRNALPELSTSFPGEHDLTLWTSRPEPYFAYYMGAVAATPAEGNGDPELSQMNLVPLETAIALLSKEFRNTSDTLDRSVYAEYCWVNQQLMLRRRKLFRVPTVEVSKAFTGINPGAAEILAYELSLKALDAPADGILNLAISGPDEVIAQSMKHLALIHVRPARLSTAKLLAEEFSTSLKLVY